MIKSTYLYSWNREEFNYDLLIFKDDVTGKTRAKIQKCDKLMGSNNEIEMYEREFMKAVNMWIAACRGMTWKDAKNKITSNKTFIKMCSAFGDRLVSLNTGGRR